MMEKQKFFAPRLPAALSQYQSSQRSYSTMNFTDTMHTLVRGDHSAKLKCENQFFNLLFKRAKELLLERYRMEMNLQFSIDDLVNPPVSPSYFSSGEEMDVDIQSVEATVSSSDDSNIEVIACYRQLPVQTQPTVGGRQMTTDLSGCSDNAFPDFPWDNFESLLLSADEQADPLVMGAGPSGAQRTGSPVISQCG